MKLNLNASDQELENQIAEEIKKDWYRIGFVILGCLAVIGLITIYFYYSDQQRQEAKALADRKMETLVSGGTRTGADITKAWKVVTRDRGSCCRV